MAVALSPLIWRFAPDLQNSLCPRTNKEALCIHMDVSYILS